MPIELKNPVVVNCDKCRIEQVRFPFSGSSVIADFKLRFYESATGAMGDATGFSCNLADYPVLAALVAQCEEQIAIIARARGTIDVPNVSSPSTSPVDAQG